MHPDKLKQNKMQLLDKFISDLDAIDAKAMMGEDEAETEVESPDVAVVIEPVKEPSEENMSMEDEMPMENEMVGEEEEDYPLDFMPRKKRGRP